MQIVKWVEFDQYDQYKTDAALMFDGAKFTSGMRWEHFMKHYFPCGNEKIELLRAEIVKRNIKCDGYYHQNNDTPTCAVFSDGTIAAFKMRGWGALMAAVWSTEENKDYDYLDFAFRIYDVAQKSIIALSKKQFCTLVQHNVIHDARKAKKMAFISILDTDISDPPPIAESSDGVLVISFDDVEQDYEVDGTWVKAPTLAQAREIMQFAHTHQACSFVIHCTAGISRSGAVATAIHDFFGEKTYAQFRTDNPYILPLNHLVQLLYQAAYEMGLTVRQS